MERSFEKNGCPTLLLGRMTSQKFACKTKISFLIYFFVFSKVLPAAKCVTPSSLFKNIIWRETKKYYYCKTSNASFRGLTKRLNKIEFQISFFTIVLWSQMMVFGNFFRKEYLFLRSARKKNFAARAWQNSPIFWIWTYIYVIGSIVPILENRKKC